MSAPAAGTGPQSGAVRRVALESLTLTDYRNYYAASVKLDGRHVVLSGPNGAGKTNLMEAVSLLSPGRGLRRATLADMARAGASDGFSVFAAIDHDGERFSVGTGTAGSAPSAEDSGLARKIRINATATRSAEELLALSRIMWLTPAMDGLFTGGSGDRRRFADRMVLAIDPAHGRRASDYEKAMRQRNRLLDEPVNSNTAAWIDAAEAQMAALGTAIIAARQELVGHIVALMDDDDAGSEFPTGIITLEGELEAMARTGVPASEIEALFGETLSAMRHRDRAAGRTLTGPHRADLVVHHRQKDIAAALCSTGEQKALLTGLVLAHARLTRDLSQMTPILLLDEIAAHLDPNRRAALFDRVDSLGGQAFMTGTDRSLFDALGQRAQYFHVGNGKVSEVE